MFQSSSDPRYPLGKFVMPEAVDDTILQMWIGMLAEFPQKLTRELQALDVEDYDTPYREGGWTVRQVVHHLADSHINAYIRTRLALTEDNPTIKPYKEALWAELEDAATAPVHLSVSILEAVHTRWALLFQSLQASDFEKTFIHPETKRVFTLKEQLGLYIWHGRHHIAHIHSVISNKAGSVPEKD